MGLKRIDERLSRVATIVKGWNGSSSVPRIERDLALEELRHIYDEILDYTPEQTEECAEEKTEPVEREERAVVTVAPIAESIADVVDDFDDALDIDALLGIGAEEESATSQEQSIAEAEETPKEEVVEEAMNEVAEEIIVESEPEIVVEPEPMEEPIVEPEAEVAAETETAPEAEDAAAGALFNLDDIPVRAKRGRKMVHLYSDNFTSRVVTAQEDEPAESEPEAEATAQPVQPAVERVVVEEQSAEEPKCLADVLGGGVKTLGDAMASSDEPTTPLNRVTELRKAIGLNDKFLLVRDLFGGDVERYEATIDTLDEFEDLDECMIYIVENFRWNPDSEAARLIVSLLERKLA